MSSETTNIAVQVTSRDINHTSTIQFGSGPQAKRDALKWIDEQKDETTFTAWGKSTESYRLVEFN